MEGARGILPWQTPWTVKGCCRSARGRCCFPHGRGCFPILIEPSRRQFWCFLIPITARPPLYHHAVSRCHHSQLTLLAPYSFCCHGGGRPSISSTMLFYISAFFWSDCRHLESFLNGELPPGPCASAGRRSSAVPREAIPAHVIFLFRRPAKSIPYALAVLLPSSISGSICCPSSVVPESSCNGFFPKNCFIYITYIIRITYITYTIFIINITYR